jgi:hypothetical protein
MLTGDSFYFCETLDGHGAESDLGSEYINDLWDVLAT